MQQMKRMQSSAVSIAPVIASLLIDQGHRHTILNTSSPRSSISVIQICSEFLWDASDFVAVTLRVVCMRVVCNL
jgi:hypothetical protein